MMTIMNSVPTAEIKEIFGIGYCTMNNQSTLTDNYNNILSERGYLLSKLYYFIDNTAISSVYAITTSDLDLLCFNTFKYPINQPEEYPKYYGQEELNLIRVLKKLALTKEEFTQEDCQVLYSFIRNRKKVEDIISISTYNKLLLDKKTVEQLLALITKHVLPLGHTIKIYESLCHDLNLNTYDSYQKLEYKYNT